MSKQTKAVDFGKLTDLQQKYMIHMKVYGVEPRWAYSNTRYALGNRGLIAGGRGDTNYFLYPVITELGMSTTPDPDEEWLAYEMKSRAQEVRDEHANIVIAQRNINEAERKLELLRVRMEANQS